MDVQFINLSTGVIIGYLWDFGDGSPTSTLAAPLHHFAQDIIYTVSLTVYGAFGDSSSVTQPVDLRDYVTDTVLAFV